MPSRQLVIKCSTVDPEPCSQAFTVAATAVAGGVSVSLWLTGDASFLATPGRAEEFSLPHAARLADLRVYAERVQPLYRAARARN